jgi:hypothetical protein
MNKLETALQNFFEKTSEEKDKVINKMVDFLDLEINRHEPRMLGFLKMIELTQSSIAKNIENDKYELAYVQTQAFNRIREKYGKTKIEDIV